MPENGLALHFLCREWVLKSSLLIAMAVYTYLRLIVDHHGTAPLQALRQKEVDFCISLLRERVSRAEPSVHTAHSAAGGRAASFGPPPARRQFVAHPHRGRALCVSSPHPLPRRCPPFPSSLRAERGRCHNPRFQRLAEVLERKCQIYELIVCFTREGTF